MGRPGLITICLLAGLTGLVGAMPLRAEPTGLWLTEDGKARVEVNRCDAGYCATIVELGEPLDEAGNPRVDDQNPDPEKRDRPIVGIEILRIDDTPNRKGIYTGGRIYDPENGKSYKCRLWEDGEELVIKGYIGITLLGRKTRWRRAE